MQSNSKGKGIQQEDVWAAADSLVADGLRPTIERVRQKIGRGSPNTVSPMLEAWFATLAMRLGVNASQSKLDAVPKELQQAMNNLWEMALSKSKEESDLQMVQAQAELTRAKEILQTREDALAQQELLRLAKHEALQEALGDAKRKAQDALARLEQAQILTGKREAEIEGLRSRLTVVEDERDSERRRSDETTTRHNRELQKQEEHAQATQHKLLGEIDVARQDAKKTHVNNQVLGKRLNEERNLLMQKNGSLMTDLLKAQELCAAQGASLHALQNALTVSSSRSDELRNLLEKQQIGSQNTIARLTEVLTAHTDRQPAGKTLLTRKIKRIVGLRKI